jgi:predicted metalloprotease with PDZ domain
MTPSIFALLVAASTSVPSPRPTISYDITIDSARADVIGVTIHLRNAPTRVQLAMKVHPEYDARFWRYVEFESKNVRRADTTLWEAPVANGSADIRYTIRLPRDTTSLRRAWQCVVRSDGALINPPDVLLYLPQFADAPATIAIHAPASWRIATALAAAGPRALSAPSAAEMLDSPIMLGHIRQWDFDAGGTRFVVAYWPLPNATPFDPTAFVANIGAITREALGIFRSAPTSAFWFLLQDGAEDALEHQSSVAIGVPSAALARDPRAHAVDIAHEFFHTWNLVAIHPDSYGELTYRRSPANGGLWLGEGVTLHYADVLVRRARLTDSANTRVRHLEGLLTRYYSVPWSTTVSPEAASLAFGQTMIENPNATSGYYLQGELLGEALDAAIRDSTHEQRSLDDLMRALYEDSRSGKGFSSQDVEHAASKVCGCRLASFFDRQVRRAGLIDLAPAAARLGWRIVVDTVAFVDEAGVPVPDLRFNVGSVGDSAIALAVTYPAGAWARSGVRTGDVVESLNGARVSNVGQLFATLRRLRVGDAASLNLRRSGAPVHIDMILRGYDRPRVRLVDLPIVTAEQRAKRARWIGGW